MKTTLAALIIGLFLVPLAVFAHHSFSAQFDTNKPINLKGTVAKLEWTNPHSWLYVDTKDESGKAVQWRCELVSPNQLRRAGVTRETVKIGDQVVIEGNRAREGAFTNQPNTCHARAVKTIDGKPLIGDE
jgi:hypothetical protein